MEIKQSGENVTGTYATSNGKIFGTLKGNILESYWVQSKANKRCSTMKYDSNYWGRLRFEFDRTGHLKGNWGYCDNEPTSGDG